MERWEKIKEERVCVCVSVVGKAEGGGGGTSIGHKSMYVTSPPPPVVPLQRLHHRLWHQPLAFNEQRLLA
jgi:hypothetical protein